MASGRREGKDVVDDNECFDSKSAVHEESGIDVAEPSELHNRAVAKEVPNPEREKHVEPVLQSVSNVATSSGGGRHEL